MAIVTSYNLVIITHFAETYQLTFVLVHVNISECNQNNPHANAKLVLAQSLFRQINYL